MPPSQIVGGVSIPLICLSTVLALARDLKVLKAVVQCLLEWTSSCQVSVEIRRTVCESFVVLLFATVYLKAGALLASLIFRGAHTTVLQSFDAYNVTRPSGTAWRSCRSGIVGGNRRRRIERSAFVSALLDTNVHTRFSRIAFPSHVCRFLLLSGSVATRPMCVAALLRVRLKCSAFVGVHGRRASLTRRPLILFQQTRLRR